MARIERTIEIGAPPETIWPMVRWDRVPEWMTQITKAEYTSQQKETIGAIAHVSAKAGGIKSEWDAETTEWIEGHRFAWRTIAGTFTGIGSMTLSPTNTGTKTTFIMDYDLPYSFLGKIVDKLRVCKAIEKGTERALQKLKETIEVDKEMGGL